RQVLGSMGNTIEPQNVTVKELLSTISSNTEDAAMLSKLGRWVPLGLEKENGNIHGFLTSPQTAAALLASPTAAGTWFAPISNQDLNEDAQDDDFDIHYLKKYR
ncbi:hypothetical protein MBANPS3_011144, partial [Mucor bainieri]